MKRIATVLAVLACSCFVSAADETPSTSRWTHSLSGQWEFSPPDSEKFYPSQVPGTWIENVPGADYKTGCDKWLTGTYRREFVVPPGVKAAAVEFGSIRWGGEVFVNGTSVGKHDLAYAPVAFDISSAIKPGKNRIEVKPIGWKAVERFDAGDPVIPCGAAHWFGSKLAGITGEVTLRFYAGARVSGVRIMPKSTGPSCDVEVTVTAGAADWQGTVAVQIVTDEGKPVGGGQRWFAKTSANRSTTVTFRSVVAPGAKLWWPHDPVMHRAVVWLETAGGPKKIASVREETFGFRDVAVRGGNFFLNGKRLVLFGYSGVWIYGNYDFMRDDRRLRNHQVVLFRAMNAGAFRCHQDAMAQKWIDLCDRNGILIACEFPNFPDMQRLPKWSLESPYDRPRFVKNLRRDLRGQIFDRYNHPSIVIWSATNEGNGFSDWERRNLLPFVKSVDPTRPVMFSSDITDTIADHHNFAGLWYGSHADFRRTAVDLARRYPDRLVGCTEFGQFGKSYRFYGRGMKEVPATEHVRNRAQLLMEQIETFRQLRYDIIMPYCVPYGGKATESGNAEDTPEHFDAMKNAFAPLGVSIDLTNRHAPTGAAVDVPVWLLSDADDATGSVTVDVMILVEHPGFKWDGNVAARKVVARRRFAEVIVPWQAKKRTLRFMTPAAEGVYTIAAVLRRPGKAPVVSLRPLRCYTSPPPAKKRLTVGVVERDGRIARWLAARGHRVVLVRGEHLPDVIVVGEGAVTDARLRGGGGFMVSERVKRGGARLVLLEQQAWSPRALTGRICKDLVGVPLRVPAQEIFPEDDAIRKAVGGDRDFRRLNGVSNHALRVRLEPPTEETKAAGKKPEPKTENPWRPLMAAFTRGPKKPDWALVYRSFGEGEVFACQVPLMGRIDRAKADDYDPVAERLLAWLIEGDSPVEVAAMSKAQPVNRQTVGVVSNVKVVSDKVADVSSVDAWRKSYIKPGMTHREKALAVWRSMVAHQHQDAPPIEHLHSPEHTVLDPIKMMNVYGYSFCSVHASHVAALARAAGLTARNKSVQRHCVSEIFYDGEWHLLDASLVNYFPKPDGKIASVDEVIANIVAWYEKHPGLKGNPEKLRAFCKDPGWKKGPSLLAACPFYGEDGLLPATFPWQCGWPETMVEFDGSRMFPYESGYSMGYRVNVQLREGERLTRNWSNRGLHLQKGEGGKPGREPESLKGKVGEGSLRYSPKYGDLAPGRIGNGVHEYDVPLASGAFRGGALEVVNLAAKADDGKTPAIHVKDPAKMGVLVIRMPSSYVYLTGEATFDAVVGEGERIFVSFSDNNGLNWKGLKQVRKSGKVTIDLKPRVFRRYDYRLKFELTGAGTGLDALNIRHDVQHSQRPLPALDKGTNTITFSAANEGTVTIEGATDLRSRGKQLVYTDFQFRHYPVVENVGPPMLSVKGRTGWIAFPVDTPGDMTRLRIHTFYRARGDGDRWDVEVSFGGEKTWKPVGTLTGPHKAMGAQFVVTDVPPGKRFAKVRWTGTQRNTAMIFMCRIDADYVEPNGGFRPVKVTYVWDEGGREKHDVHVAKTSSETYAITCAAKPVMKSLIVELAGE